MSAFGTKADIARTPRCAIAGAGLPGFLVAGGGLLAWWRGKRKAEA